MEYSPCTALFPHSWRRDSDNSTGAVPLSSPLVPPLLQVNTFHSSPPPPVIPKSHMAACPPPGWLSLTGQPCLHGPTWGSVVWDPHRGPDISRRWEAFPLRYPAYFACFPLSPERLAGFACISSTQCHPTIPQL
eukprot:GGOE01047341.1.p2 GENE.GGOE01047341.1~~GGOE01047341.1.p2  ORF type:complete len:134 (-),score=1.40 GGOE01047341.1:416-817(-)